MPASVAPTATFPRSRCPRAWDWSPTASPTSCRAAASTSSTTPSTRPGPRCRRIRAARTSSSSRTSRSSSGRTAATRASPPWLGWPAGLGLPQELLLEDIEGLSGGQRRRVDLIRILFQGPDTMILDEPTNHLDLPAKRWLMEELERFPGAILVVAHDLKLLDRSINKVLHLSDGRLHEFKGTYSSYMVQLEADQSQRERAAQLEGREIKRLSTLADSMRGSTNRRARIAKSLDKRVERLEAGKTEVHKREKKSSFRLPTPRRSGEVPLRTTGLSVRYDTTTVLRKVDFHCRRE